MSLIRLPAPRLLSTGRIFLGLLATVLATGVDFSLPSLYMRLVFIAVILLASLANVFGQVDESCTPSDNNIIALVNYLRSRAGEFISV